MDSFTSFYRSFLYIDTLQGLGKTAIPTISGVMELVMRLVAAFLLVPSFGFIGASIATPLSWFGALIPSAVAYFIASKQLKGGETQSTDFR